MIILSKKPLTLIRLIFSIASILSLLTLILIVSLAVYKFVGDKGTLERLLRMANDFVPYKKVEWYGVAVTCIIFLTAYISFEWASRLFKPIPRKLYIRVNNVAAIVPKVETIMHKITSSRDYVTRHEYKVIMRKYKKAAKKQLKQLNKINRYPDGEQLWPELEYV